MFVLLEKDVIILGTEMGKQNRLNYFSRLHEKARRNDKTANALTLQLRLSQVFMIIIRILVMCSVALIIIF